MRSSWRQVRYEKGMTDLAAGLAGADIIYESAGMLASLIGCSLENFVIDDEMLAAARQTIRGFEVSEESLSIDVIRDAVTGPGHYLGQRVCPTSGVAPGQAARYGRLRHCPAPAGLFFRT